MHRLYAFTLALAAFLLIWAELLFGRLLLPPLGGAPGVWTTCLLFFQATLFVGYVTCLATSRWVGTWRQVVGVGALLAAAGVALPFGVDPARVPGPEASQVAGVLALLVYSVGLPFLAVSCLSPLLQAWYGRLGREDSDDPYFLYAASNAGSFLALVAYPLLIEPRVALSKQVELWTLGFAGLALSLLACAACLLPSQREPGAERPAASSPPDPVAASRLFGRWRVPVHELRWVWLSFVPACLLYGVTTAITTDVAAMPLLWAAPLAIYLASFVFAFARRRVLPFERLRALVPLVVVALIVSSLFGNRGPLWFTLALHLGGFALVACVLHRDLAALRPSLTSAGRLEGYYVWIAGGGLLAGVASALVAPLILHTAVDYLWALLLAGLLAARRPFAGLTTESPRPAPAPWLTSEGLPALAALRASSPPPGSTPTTGLARSARGALAFSTGALACVLVGGYSSRFLLGNMPGYLLAALLLAVIARPLGLGRRRVTAAFAFVFLVGQCALGPLSDSLYIGRNFFGVQRVVQDEARQLHSLYHGTTVHGRQGRGSGERGIPLAYYGREGPAGQVFAALELLGKPGRVGVIGLGVGSLVAYARPAQVWAFYEIDPAVERIARDPALFSFLADAPVPVVVVSGDARLTLAAAGADDVYDLLVLDAFSSDVIPVHLLTREAFALYDRRLAPHGLILANVSNRYLDVEPVFAAHAHELGMFARVQRDLQPTRAAQDSGITASSWVAMAHSQRDLAGIDADERWEELRGDDRRTWTDDHADVLAALR